MKKFRSIDGTEKRVALLSSHVFIVGDEWVEIPDFAWSETYAAGCISDDMVGSGFEKMDVPLQTVAIGKDMIKEKIRKIIIKKYQDNDKDFFSKVDDKPKSNFISREVNTRVTNELRDEVWADIQLKNELNFEVID